MIRDAVGFAFGKFMETFKRFPLAVICVVAFNIIAEFDLVLPFDPPLPYDGRPLVFLLLYCGAFWSVSVKLYSESHGLSLRTSYAMSVIIFFLVLFLSAVLQIIGVGALVYALPVLFVSMLIAPFIRRGTTLKEIWAFHNDFWSHIGRAIPIVILLYIIGGGILYSLYHFFDLPIGRKEGGALTGIVLFLYLPLTALAGIPKIRK